MREKDRDRYRDKLKDQLDNGILVIYALVGICFFLGSIFALANGFWDFAILIQRSQWHPPEIGQAIIQLISDLLLVLIIMEVLGTVMDYLGEDRFRGRPLKPFLHIGIISVTRGILSIGAKLSVGGERIDTAEFNRAMIELGVYAAVILAIGITLKLLPKDD